MFSLTVKVCGLGYRNPFPRSGPGGGIQIFGIILAIFAVLDAKLHIGWRGGIDGAL